MSIHIQILTFIMILKDFYVMYMREKDVGREIKQIRQGEDIAISFQATVVVINSGKL